MRRPRPVTATAAPQTAGPSRDGARLQRFHAAITRGLWALVLCPPLLACLALAVLALAHRPQPVHTGDALLDAYLQAVVDNDSVLVGFYSPKEHFSLPETAWLKLEAMFKRDPRFWLLCYRYRDADLVESAPAVNPVAGVSMGYSRVRYLEAARANHAAQLRHYLILLWQYRSAWRDEADTAGRLLVLTRKSTPAERAAYNHAVRNEIDLRHQAVEQQLLAEMTASAPEHPLPKYVAAMTEAERGNYALARRLLAEGNRLAQARRRDGTLGRDALANPFPGDAGMDKILLRGIRQDLLDSALSPVARSFTDASSLLAEHAATTHDPSLLQELHLFGCYAGIAFGYQILTTPQSQYILKDVEQQAFLAHHGQLTPAQTANLADLAAAVGQVRTIQKHAYSPASRPPSHLPDPGTLQWRVLQVIDRASGNHHIAVLNELDTDQMLQTRTAFVSKMDEQCSKLLRFDYTTLDWRADAPAH